MSVSDVVNMLEKGWSIVEGGKPSPNIKTSTANAVPDVQDWQGLVGAKGPIRIYMPPIQNEVGWPFDDYLNVDIQIVLSFEYAATYNGGGAFIPNIFIEVPECFLGWRYTADIDIQVRNPSNGNEANPRAPIARVPVTISGTYGNPLWSQRIEWSFLLWGTGQWQQT